MAKHTRTPGIRLNVEALEDRSLPALLTTLSLSTDVLRAIQDPVTGSAASAGPMPTPEHGPGCSTSVWYFDEGGLPHYQTICSESSDTSIPHQDVAAPQDDVPTAPAESGTDHKRGKQYRIVAATGDAEYRLPGGKWQPITQEAIEKGLVVPEGTAIQTGLKSRVVFHAEGTPADSQNIAPSSFRTLVSEPPPPPPAPAKPGPVIYNVTDVHGDAEARLPGDAKWRKVQVGDVLPPGTKLQTGLKSAVILKPFYAFYEFEPTETLLMRPSAFTTLGVPKSLIQLTDEEYAAWQRGRFLRMTQDVLQMLQPAGSSRPSRPDVPFKVSDPGGGGSIRG